MALVVLLLTVHAANPRVWRVEGLGNLVAMAGRTMKLAHARAQALHAGRIVCAPHVAALDKSVAQATTAAVHRWHVSVDCVRLAVAPAKRVVQREIALPLRSPAINLHKRQPAHRDEAATSRLAPTAKWLVTATILATSRAHPIAKPNAMDLLVRSRRPRTQR